MRERAWRALLGAAALLLLVAGTGCISVPATVRENVSGKGASATRVRPLLGQHVVETASFVPGRSGGRHTGYRLACAGQASAVEVRWGDEAISVRDATELCQASARALDYVSALSGVDVARIRFGVTLVPEGQAAMVRSLSTTLFGRLRPRYAKPVLASMPMTTAGLQSTLAHESTHIAAALRGQDRADVANEEIAYLAGYCATFDALGRIEDGTLVQAQLREDSGAPASAVRSNREGARVSRMIREITRGETVSKGTPAGDRLETLCRTRLEAFFSGDPG